MRNPAARSNLVALEDAMIDSVAKIIESERTRRGIESGESVTRLARVVEAFTRGISMMRVLDPEAIDEPFLEAAVDFLAKGLSTPSPQAGEEDSPP